MTVVIVSAADVAWVRPTAELLRARGLKVVVLGTLSVVGFLLMSDKIAAVVVHEDRAPDWEAARSSMQRIAGDTKLVLVARDDSRSPAELAQLIP